MVKLGPTAADGYLARAVRLGVQITVAALVPVAVLPWLPGHGDVYRLGYVAVAASALAVLGVVGALPWQALLARRWGAGLLYGWSVADIGLITLLIVWSGGGQSQLWLLYALTSLFFAACYQPLGQCVLGALTAGGYFAALAVTGWHVTVADLTLRSVGLLLVTLMASFLSREKQREASVSDHRSALLATVAGAARDLSVLGPDEVLSGVMGTVTALGFDGASISIIDERLGTYRVAYTWDMPPDYGGSVHPIGTGVTGMVLEAGATVGVDDYTTHERGVDLVRAAGFHAVVGCPLHVAGEIAGVLSAGRKSDRPLCSQDVEAFELLAALASRALENARRYADLAESEARTRHQAQHDALTGLANRTLLRERILSALRQPRRAGRVTALIFIDLDDFKAVNDALGHGAGDVLLVEVAERLGSELRDGDAAARLGGDEFAVLLASVEPDAVAPIAERLLESITAPIHVLGTTVTTHASMGVAITERAEVGVVSRERSEAAVDMLLRDADVAMYEAKQTGDCHVLFEHGMRQRLLERLTLETDLPGAIRHGDLSLVYQPIFDLDTGRLEGVEALLRWSHPDRGPIPPDVFIPLAESTGQIIPMGRWVLREACEQLQAWRREYPGCADLGLSVNLSTRQLTDPILVDTVRSVLNATGIPPRQLTLEITETALLQDVTSTLPALEALAVLGVRLALDDFGTGYSSLSYLRRMPVHTIKIDRSFAEGVTSGSTESTLVNLIVDLSRGLGLDTVAEGIETAEQHAELRALGCTRGQGFLLGRPAPAEGIAALLARRTVANAGPFMIQTAPVPVRERLDRLVGPTI